MTFNFDWQALLTAVIPVVFSWLMGSLGIGVPGVTPQRRFNKE